MTADPTMPTETLPEDADDEVSLLDVAIPLVANLKLLLLGPLMAALLALGVTFLITPTFTAKTVFLPPQQQQSAATSALASLGALSGLVGAAVNVKSPADQYVALMQSNSVTDRIIDEFKLMDVYDVDYLYEARKELANNIHVSIGKKDGLIALEVDDTDPKRAANMANRHVDELRRVTSELTLTEAKQRRAFFEEQLKQTNQRLAKAQTALQASGFNAGALKTEPKSAAERYARLQAELTAAEVRLQALRRSLADASPEIQQQSATVAALRRQIAKSESASADVVDNVDYVSKYRDFKYEEALFEQFARQYEMARLDESREGVLIQVIDPALPPERKSSPKRALTAIAAAAIALLVLAVIVIARDAIQRATRNDPTVARKVDLLRAALGRR